jgi:hypothetical protein
MADGWTGVQVEYTTEGLRMPGSWRLHAGHVLTIVAHPHPDSLRCILATPSAN